MAVEIRRPALDFLKDVAIGIDLPMSSFQGSSFALNYLTLDQAVANAKNLLLTNHGERPMLPLFGCNLRRVLFENLGADDLLVDSKNDKRHIIFNQISQFPFLDRHPRDYSLYTSNVCCRVYSSVNVETI